MTKGKDVNTIDAIIRRKADSRLTKELDDLFTPVRHKLSSFSGLSGDQLQTSLKSLDQMKSMLFLANRETYQDTAIDKFVAKHDELQKALDDLKTEVGE